MAWLKSSLCILVMAIGVGLALHTIYPDSHAYDVLAKVPIKLVYKNGIILSDRAFTHATLVELPAAVFSSPDRAKTCACDVDDIPCLFRPCREGLWVCMFQQGRWKTQLEKGMHIDRVLPSDPGCVLAQEFHLNAAGKRRQYVGILQDGGFTWHPYEVDGTMYGMSMCCIRDADIFYEANPIRCDGDLFRVYTKDSPPTYKIAAAEGAAPFALQFANPQPGHYLTLLHVWRPALVFPASVVVLEDTIISSQIGARLKKCLRVSFDAGKSWRPFLSAELERYANTDFSDLLYISTTPCWR